MPSIEELRAQLAQAEKDAAQAAQDELKALPREYEWRATMVNKYTVRVERRLSPASIAGYEAWRAKYPNASVSSWNWPKDAEHWNGMNYILVGNVIAEQGGGWCVLSFGDKSKSIFDREPTELPQEQADALRTGQVPMELRA